MKSKNRASLTIVQMNDTHAYFDVHQDSPASITVLHSSRCKECPENMDAIVKISQNLL